MCYVKPKTSCCPSVTLVAVWLSWPHSWWSSWLGNSCGGTFRKPCCRESMKSVSSTQLWPLHYSSHSFTLCRINNKPQQDNVFSATKCTEPLNSQKIVFLSCTNKILICAHKLLKLLISVNKLSMLCAQVIDKYFPPCSLFILDLHLHVRNVYFHI